jgi:hypothetical protein
LLFDFAPIHGSLSLGSSRVTIFDPLNRNQILNYLFLFKTLHDGGSVDLVIPNAILAVSTAAVNELSVLI